MKSTRATVLVLVLCLAPLLGAAADSGTDTSSMTALQQEPCCFKNPRFSGICQVVPGPDESCGDILAYLNTPNTVGKSYCGKTEIRGGWTQVPCEEASASSAASCEAPQDR